ncbi:hypothetical protein RD110_03085 [Rhodoferax koreense]|uniref:Uncharacterized protein n=1 Tax=Rhodoferax koreensis TaxID=1842727 RepID=A0A1P8JRF3_9BURK|nr:hypothetical protein [Rhodoferax koreense]APW36320.1 hypothetical protein RD110_03085 [Rhodoferax koreense]
MHSTISSRRQAITVVLLVFAAAGGLVRWLAPQPSLARDLGSLLLVLWLPIIGNIIAWLVARAHKPKAPQPGFASDRAFAPSIRIELTLLAASVPAQNRPVRAGLFPCMLALGSEAFSARLRVPHGEEPVPEVPKTLEVELLRPELALPRLPAGSEVMVLAGRSLLGRGHVIGVAEA